MPLSKYKPTGLNGYVKFNIPEVSHDAIGTVAVCGKYRRIKPHRIRPEVDPTIIDAMADKLTAWAEECGFKYDHFERDSIKTMALTAVQFGFYWYPEVPLDSRQMYFFLLSLFWTWLMDDALEEAWFDGRFHKGNIQTLRYIHKTYLKIVRNQPIDNPLPEFPELPEFKAICKCVQDAVNVGMELTGGKYEEAVEPLAENLQTILECNEWFSVSKLDGRYSLRTYHGWRRSNAGPNSMIEASAFADGIHNPWEIRNNPAFRRMMSIMMSNIQWVNDVLGVKKDFEYKGGELDNEVVFRVLCKGDPIELAVQEICVSIEEELRDFILIKQALIDMFGEEESLLRYLDKVDIFIDGHNQVYVDNIRYRCKIGFVRLTREDDDE